MNTTPLESHIPFQQNSAQTILKTMDKQFVILSVSSHFAIVHDQMAFWTGVSFVFLKFRSLEFCRHDDIRNQTHILSSNPKVIIAFHGSQSLFQSLILFFDIFNISSIPLASILGISSLVFK